ncbi:MAG: hypothetical protein JSW00_12585 [Thermoplasmata archaeon]|nr:MAG: hypothetical protein JSW00_12585 [Thermoplasmata archaeon]
MPHCKNCDIEFTGDFCPKCGQDAVSNDSVPLESQEQSPPQSTEEPIEQPSDQSHKPSEETPESPEKPPMEPTESPSEQPIQPIEEPLEQPTEQPIQPMIPPTAQIVSHIPAQLLYQPPTQGPFPQRAVAALVLGIIVVIMLLISGATAWFWTDQENGSEVIRYYTFKEEISETDGVETERDLDDIPGVDLEDVAGVTNLLLILGIIMMILVIIMIGLMIGLFYMRMHRQTKLWGNLALLFSLLALIFVLLAPIYYMTAWTNEMDDYTNDLVDSFIGSDSVAGTDNTWGPGIGWMLAIVCIVMILVNLFVVKLGRDEVKRLAPYMPPVPQFTPQPQPLYYPSPQLPPQYTPQPQPPQYTPSPQPPRYTPSPQPPQYTPPPQPPPYTPSPQLPQYIPATQPPQYTPSPQPPAYAPIPQPQIQPSDEEPPSQPSDIQPTPTSEIEEKTVVAPKRKKELSTEEKLNLLTDRFLKGEISEKTYLEIKERFEKRT